MVVLRVMGSKCGEEGGGTSETASGGNGKASHFKILPRQNSLCGLTLDEVQNWLTDLGKPRGSTNLDELLKSISIADPGQSTGVDVENAMSGNQSTLQHQSSRSLAGTLSKETVDDVWKEIQQTKSEEHRCHKFKHCNPDFPAGSVDEVFATSVSHPQHGMSMMPVYMHAQTFPQLLQTCAGPMMDLPFADNHLALPSPLTGVFSDMHPSGRKRGIPDDVLDKSIERKQKRMIKNLESAALGSRARKQDYTNELDNKVSHLEEENERLRKRKVGEVGCQRLDRKKGTQSWWEKWGEHYDGRGSVLKRYSHSHSKLPSSDLSGGF